MARKKNDAAKPDENADKPEPDKAPAPRMTRVSDNPIEKPPGGPFGDIRPPAPQPPRQYTPIFEPLPTGWQVYQDGHWVNKPGIPPKKMVGYFEYRGYWLHYDPYGTSTGAARFGIYLGGGFYAGQDEPPAEIPPVGWDLPPKV